MASAINDAGSDQVTRFYGPAVGTDAPKNLLAAADAVGGFGVYLGLQTEDGWATQLTTTWASGAAARSSMIASELLADVGPSPSLRGWFLAPEPTSAFVASSTQQSVFAGYLSQTASRLHSILPGSKAMLAPSFDTFAPPAAFTSLMNSIARSGIDIATVQDQTGVPYEHTVDNSSALQYWFGLARAAVNAANVAGGAVALWSDLETFHSADWTPASTKQVVTALTAEAPYVQGVAAFAFVHYMSSAGWYPAYDAPYRRYARTGKLPAFAPTSPTPTLRAADFDMNISWPAAADRPSPGYLPAINQYQVYRTQGQAPARLIAVIGTNQTSTICPGGTSYCFVDPQLKPGARYTYKVVVMNGAGNTSSATVTAVTPTLAAGESDLALRSAHTVVPSPSPSYPEVAGSLDDGVVGPANDQSPTWAGWLNQNPTVTVDLGSVQPVTEIESFWLQQLVASVVLPASVSYETSQDGITWTPTLRAAVAPNIDATDQVATYRALAAPGTRARWVRVLANDTGAWVFASEITVHG